MLAINDTSAFRKDIKILKKRGKDMKHLLRVVERLSCEEKLPAKHRPHKLVGNWSPYWECHIEPDWLLIYEATATDLYLIRTGTHSDLFK